MLESNKALLTSTEYEASMSVLKVFESTGVRDALAKGKTPADCIYMMMTLKNDMAAEIAEAKSKIPAPEAPTVPFSIIPASERKPVPPPVAAPAPAPTPVQPEAVPEVPKAPRAPRKPRAPKEPKVPKERCQMLKKNGEQCVNDSTGEFDGMKVCGTHYNQCNEERKGAKQKQLPVEAPPSTAPVTPPTAEPKKEESK